MTLFDPLDRELFERALEAAHAAVEASLPCDALDSDEVLEHALRSELIDIALTAGISDAETLCDFALQAFEQGRSHLGSEYKPNALDGAPRAEFVEIFRPFPMIRSASSAE